MNHPINWQPGMLLTAAHLQQRDHYMMDLLANSFRQKPYFWGVESVVINELAMVQGYFALLQCQAIFKNGHVYQANAQDYLPNPIVVAQDKPLLCLSVVIDESDCAIRYVLAQHDAATLPENALILARQQLPMQPGRLLLASDHLPHCRNIFPFTSGRQLIALWQTLLNDLKQRKEWNDWQVVQLDQIATAWRVATEHKTVHPYQLYQWITHCCWLLQPGEIIHDYMHHDCYAALQAALQHLQKLAQVKQGEAWELLSITHVDRQTIALDVSCDLTAYNQLAITCDEALTQIKIVPQQELAYYVQHALPGLPCKQQTIPFLPARYSYSILHRDNPLIHDLNNNSPLVIFSAVAMPTSTTVWGLHVK